jgi:hypothetical protein
MFAGATAQERAARKSNDAKNLAKAFFGWMHHRNTA